MNKLEAQSQLYDELNRAVVDLEECEESKDLIGQARYSGKIHILRKALQIVSEITEVN